MSDGEITQAHITALLERHKNSPTHEERAASIRAAVESDIIRWKREYDEALKAAWANMQRRRYG